MNGKINRRMVLKTTGACVGASALVSNSVSAQAKSVTSTKFAEIGLSFNGIPQKFPRVHKDGIAEYTQRSGGIEANAKMTQNRLSLFEENSEIMGVFRGSNSCELGA